MLRCLRIGFVYEPSALAWAKMGCAWATGLGRGSQSEPGCNGPYNQVTSESLSLWRSYNEVSKERGRGKGVGRTN